MINYLQKPRFGATASVLDAAGAALGIQNGHAVWGTKPIWTAQGDTSSGNASTAHNLFLWQLFAPGQADPASNIMQLTDLELAAIANASGWVKLASGGVIQLTDRRWAKTYNNGWLDRNPEAAGTNNPSPVIAAASDPGHSTWLSTAVSDVEGVAEAALPEIAKVILQIIQTIEADADAVLKLIEFFFSILGDILALIDPTGTTASRNAAKARLNPLKRGTATYNFITSADSNTELDIVLAMLIILAMIGGAFVLTNPIEQKQALKQALRDLVTNVAAGKPAFEVVYVIVMDLVDTLLGIPIGPATAMKLTYTIISGLPVPPIATCVDIIAADPIAQQYIGKSLHLPSTFTNKVVPVAMSCLNASDSAQWFNCLTGVVEAVFPGIITGLRKYSINLNDLRNIIQSAWETGGDLNLMLRSNISSATQKFGAVDLSSLTPVQSSIISVGFFGTDLIAAKIGVQNAGGFFINTFAPLMGKDTQKYIQDAYDVFRFIEQVIIEAGFASTRISPTIAPAGFVLYAIERFHTAKWDTEIAISQMIADEFDPNPLATRLFSTTLKRSPNGQILVSPAFKGLFTKLLLDFPRLNYQVEALAHKLGIPANAGLFGVRSDVDAAQAAYSMRIPGAPTHVTQSVTAPSAVPSSGAPVHQSSAPVHQSSAPAPSSSAPAASGSGASPSALAVPMPATGPSWGAIAATAGAGFVVGGPAGALLGAGIGLIFPKK